MPFIDLGDEFADTKEAPLAPEGEYDLRISSHSHNTENGKNTLAINIVFDGEDYAPMRHYIALPQPERDAKNDEEKGRKKGDTSKMKMLMLKRFCYLFDIEYTDTGFNTDDFNGSTTRGRVGQDTMTRQDGSTAPINKLQLPRLPDDD